MSNNEQRNTNEEVHVYLGFLRKKLNPNERPRCIRRIAKSESDLSILKSECKELGGIWRIHRTVNKRSTLKAFKAFQHYIIDHPDCYRYLDSVWKTMLLRPESRAEKLFMLDVDFKNEDRLKYIESDLELIEKVETPNGYHLVVKPFDRRRFAKTEDITVITDGYIFIDEVCNENF